MKAECPEIFSATKNTLSGVFRYWRRGRDSNSGWDRSHDGFQDRCIKPLCHLSVFQLEALATVVSETPFQRRFWPPRRCNSIANILFAYKLSYVKLFF